ncbi:carbohydrate-binding domain-containing protein [Cohnella algarum]|uniref:carbohydrate-binding domain-containing protein n=1 Tax=Cohnella algarum TaxID=2044859 RepID=UPI0019670EC5|nr:carbohydrate-binding domain-containing protein [Cohnella algarum]MBN2980993.1 carbohydrate-binding domain-containing protein [Cohnella algarum]
MKNDSRMKLIGITLLCAILAAGCSSNASSSDAGASSAAASAEAVQTSEAGASAATAQLAALHLDDQVEYDEDDESTAWSEDGSTMITLDGSGASVAGAGAAADGSVVTIAEAGTYVVSGTLDDGQLAVNVPDEVVHIVLNGAEIHNSDGAAIHVVEAGKAVITLQEGTENTLTDGETYADTSEDAPTAALYSKGDLTINGAGKLTVQGNGNDGITGRDDLKIVSGEIVVEAADDGILGRDLLAVKAGTIAVTAGGDGMKSSNDADAGKGVIAIAGGTFDIAAGGDGFQAATSLLIADGSFAIVSGGGSAAAAPQTGADNGGFSPQRSQTAAQTGTADTETAETTSAKGLKAAADIVIAGGSFQIDAADDAVHSNANVSISGGQFSLATGDDGIHADASLAIGGGAIDIAESYEGIEGSDIAIAGGEIRLVASDDGINVAGGNDESAAGGRGGPDSFSSSGGTLTITGGYLALDASGDGLDSNGSIVMSGGTVLVNGPTMNGNGSLDYNGTFEQTGGLLVAAGSSGMAQAPSEDSSQRSVMMTFPGALEAGTLVTLANSQGEPVVSFAPAKSFQIVVISSPDLTEGETYAFYTGGTSTGAETDGLYEGGALTGGTEVVSFALGASVTYVNESGVTTAGSGMGGMGGGRGGMGRGGMGAGRDAAVDAAPQ